MLEQIWDAIAPHFAQLVSGAITILIGAIYAEIRSVARARLGIEMEQIHREALHSALLSGALAVIDTELDKDKMVQAVLDYAENSVPDALAWLEPSLETLTSLALSKIEVALAEPGSAEIRSL